MTTPQIIPLGDSTWLTSLFANLHIFGVLSDLDTPDQVNGALEVNGPNMVLSVPVLQGVPGVPGENAPIVKLQQQIFDSSDDLPNNLTDDDVDIAKTWIIREFDGDGNAVSSKAYVWFGDHYEWFPMGSPGPAGPVPVIAWSFDMVPSSVTSTTITTKTGDDFHPSVNVKVNKELLRGPVGPATNIADAPDVDVTTPPDIGQSLTWDGTKWKPESLGTIVPKFWTMPEAAFIDVPLAFGTRVPLGSFTVPPLDFDCVPYIQGHMRITGLEADSDPFIIGAEVRLGDPNTGQVVARGFGNISTYTFLVPHSSTSATPNDAISPDNGFGVIPAGATGAAATLYINAFNDGLTGIYNFAHRGAQLSILAIPVN